MKKIVFAAFVAAAAAGCATGGGMNVQPMTQTITDWSGTLEAQDTAGIRGAAAVRSGYGQTGASVSIAGAPAGQHPWHIHSGTCGSGGAIVGDATAYPVLSVGSDGEASASATLKVELSPTGSYYVNVHQSPSDLGTIIACIPLSH